MAQYYTKINTLYKRYTDGKLKNCIILGDHSEKEVETLRNIPWACFEKIDGTNMSYHLIPTSIKETIVDEVTNTTYHIFDYNFEIHGKTENAAIPKHLLTKMESLLNKEQMVQQFTRNGIPPQVPIIIFGEGYGMKIQKGGNYIPDDCDFIVFDIKVGDVFLERPTYEEIANQLNLKCVPFLGMMTINDAEQMVMKGFKSLIAHNKDYDAEGIVAVAPHGLLNRLGKRLITKIKTCDYNQLKAKEA